MRFAQYITLQILVGILSAPTYAQSPSAEVALRTPDEQRAINDEIKAWSSEKLNGTFAYFTVKKEITPKTTNGVRYHIHKGHKFKVYGKPVVNKQGLAVVHYRSLNVSGCAYTTCTMGVPPDQLVQLTDYEPNKIAKLWDAFTEAVTSLGTDKKKCANCDENTANDKTSAQAAASAKALDRSMAWLKNYMGCDEYEYMQSQKQNLLEGEKIFGVPATAIACLIGRESRWDATAVQMHPRTGRMWGSFKGLAQTREASLETERNYLNDNYKKIYRPQARTQLDEYLEAITPSHEEATQQLAEKNIHYATDKYRDGSKWRRCGPPISQRTGNKIGRTAIGFVATYLNRTIDAEVEYLTEKGRIKEAKSLASSQRSRFLMAAAGYNAGSGHTYAMTPREAYTTDNGRWVENMRPPPFVQNAKMKVEKKCSAKERAEANKRKSRNPANVQCSSAWLASKLKPSNFKRLAQAAEEKYEEVRPYVKWIDICMTGDQSQRPPTKGPSLTNPKYLERKNEGCYTSNSLKPCPTKGSKK